jgi:hypothetical protein
MVSSLPMVDKLETRHGKGGSVDNFWDAIWDARGDPLFWVQKSARVKLGYNTVSPVSVTGTRHGLYSLR